MKLKFNRMERIAGFFVLFALAGTVVSGVGIVVKKGFFEPKVAFHTYAKTSNSIRPGMSVQLAGIRAGSVGEVTLGHNGQVKVEFVIFRKYVDRIKTDSQMQLIRPSLLGERSLEITLGSEHADAAQPGSLIRMGVSDDAIDMLSGKRITALLDNFEAISAETLLVLKQVSHGNNLRHLVGNLRTTTDQLKSSVKAEDLSAILSNMSTMSRELAKVSSQVNSSTKNLPASVENLDELLNETVILVKGMQKNFLFSGGVKEAREEQEAARRQDPQRVPAAETPPKE